MFKSVKMVVKTVMVRAWVVAREAVAKFGGKAREYFAAALKQAWVESRKPKFATLETQTGSRNHKTWVAILTGTDAKYGFKREFINRFRDIGGAREYDLANGFYDVCDGGRRRYIQVVNGNITNVDAYDIAI